MGQLDDTQTAVEPLKNRKILEYVFITILGLAESIKMMDWPDPA